MILLLFSTRFNEDFTLDTENLWLHQNIMKLVLKEKIKGKPVFDVRFPAD